MNRQPQTIAGSARPLSGPMLNVTPDPYEKATLGSMGLRGVFMFGLALLVLFFGGFGTWAALAPLETAAIAPGRVVVGSKVKVVQHLEGGIVGEILVREGSIVREGDPLIILDETQPQSTQSMVNSRLRHHLAREARLVAERDKKSRIAFPQSLLDLAKTDPEVAEIMAAQRQIFESRRESVESQIAILKQRVAQYREEINGLEAEIVADTKQLGLIQQEQGDVEFLVNRGLERRARLLQLKRTAADIEGTRARNRAAIARSRQSIAEADLRIVDLATNMHREVVEELREVQAEIADLTQQKRAADDVMRRTAIRAPASGRIVNLKVFTPGGVIAPREPLMEIVPQHDDLIVEAQINPNDIDIIEAGQRAEVRLTAFSTRATPILDGVLESVSADRLVDERTGVPYYSARIVFSDEQEQQVQGIELYPGMPAEVMIVAGQRTPLSYIAKPLTSSFQRAMRED